MSYGIFEKGRPPRPKKQFLPRVITVQGEPYYFQRIYTEDEIDEVKEYCARQKRRNGTRYYIKKTENNNSMSWIGESKYALYLNKTITLNKEKRTW